MNWSMFVWILVGVIVSFVLGYMYAKYLAKVNSLGVIRVDRSDPDEEPYLFLELNADVRVISQQKYVTFEVSNESYISQN